MIRRSILLFVVAATSLALPLTTTAQTTDVAGVKFDPSPHVAGAKLQLNGAGVRYKAVFKVYAAALYLNAKATTLDAVLAAPGPKRMQIVMLRDIDGNELGKLFTRGMQDNAPREEFSKSIAGTMKMSDVFSARKKLLTGESFSIDWLPGTGTVIMVNGKPAAEPIKEPEFYSAMMKIWLGKSPADAQLKDALLGAAPSGVSMSTY